MVGGLGQVLDTMTSPVRATGRLIFGDKPCKVAVVGAAGGIGQPLSLLLKLSPFVTELSLFDVAPFTPGESANGVNAISIGCMLVR